MLLTVTVRGEGEEVRLTASEIHDLDKILAGYSRVLKFLISSTASIDALRDLVDRGQPGDVGLTLVLDVEDGQEVELELSDTITVTEDLFATVERLPGIEAVLDSSAGPSGENNLVGNNGVR